MSFQPIQLIVALLYVIGAIALWKIKNKYIRISIVAIALIAFLFNPFYFEQKGGAFLERSVHRFDNIPQKVEVTPRSFSLTQETEMQKLKKESEELKNEIHD